jgi:hypothetical protein
MFRYLIIFVFLSFSVDFCLNAQANIDFSPKQLVSDLHEAFGRRVTLEEMKISIDSEKKAHPGKYFLVPSGSNGSALKYVYVGRVKTCRAGACTASQDASDDKESEYFDYYIFFDSLYTVQLVRIFNYQATHGQEVTSKGWLKQFKGYNGNKELVVNKNVDAISGATVSVHAITYDVTHKTSLIREITQQRKVLGQTR